MSENTFEISAASLGYSLEKNSDGSYVDSYLNAAYLINSKINTRTQPQWISVDESMPNENQQYYVVAIRNPNKFGLIYEVAYLGKQFVWYKNKNGCVEWWMTLPLPPKE